MIVADSNEDTSRIATMKLNQEFGIRFPILSSISRTIIENYGVLYENEAKGRPIARPAAFVIDAHGVIRYRHGGEGQRDRPATEDLLQGVSPPA